MNYLPSYLTPALIEQQVAIALAEDIGSGDLTAQLIPATTPLTAQILCREEAVICGQLWAEAAFRQLDPTLKIEWQSGEAAWVEANQSIATLSGSARAILTAERTALNFLQLLSGVATTTRRYVEVVRQLESTVAILDTRKTIPGLRLAQKYAVLCGGGQNHRLGLYDAVLIKENHIAAAGSIAAAVTQAQRLGQGRWIEVEVETLAELEQALTAGVSRILLDNMDYTTVREAVAITAGRAELELSGGVTLEQLPHLVPLGVDSISVGALTKQIQPIDLSLRFS